MLHSVHGARVDIGPFQLLLQVQDKEATIATLSTENKNLTSALNAAETRLHELYNEQSRWEMEMAQRIEVTDKLREQVREIEKEKRDLQRRYNEQVRLKPTQAAPVRRLIYGLLVRHLPLKPRGKLSTTTSNT